MINVNIKFGLHNDLAEFTGVGGGVGEVSTVVAIDDYI
jgi:hypothetical protein